MRTLTVTGLVLQFNGDPHPRFDAETEAQHTVDLINEHLADLAKQTGGAQLVWNEDCHVEEEID